MKNPNVLSWIFRDYMLLDNATALGGEAYLGPTYMHTEIIMVDVSIPGQHVLYKLKLIFKF